jgi:hypothetical protein
MKTRPLTKKETQEIYKAIEQTSGKILKVKSDEYKHIRGIIIIGIRDDNSFSQTNFGQVTFSEMLESFEKTLHSHYKELQEEKLKDAE